MGLGLGFDLQSDDETKYKIFGSEYTESELINNGVTKNGVTYEFKKKDDGMYVTIPTGATFDTTTTMLEDTNFGRDLLVGGDNPQPLEGESNYFYIDYAAIGVVKIGNDGYVWGGFYTSNNSDPSPSDSHLRSGLSEPVQFAKINENGEALINLGKVHELQKHIQNDLSVDNTYELNKIAEDSFNWMIFAYRKGSETIMKVAIAKYPYVVNEIYWSPIFIPPNVETQFLAEDRWPDDAADRLYWGKEENPKTQAFNNENHPTVDFRLGDLVDADGNPLTVTWEQGDAPNVNKSVPVGDLFYKVKITGGKVNLSVIDKKIQITPEGKFELAGQTFQIPIKQDSYTFENALEVKLTN